MTFIFNYIKNVNQILCGKRVTNVDDDMAFDQFKKTKSRKYKIAQIKENV